MSKLINYHESCIKVLKVNERACEVESVKEKIFNGEIVHPTRPKYGLQKLLQFDKPVGKYMQCSERLHTHLIKLLVSDLNVPDAKFPDAKNKQAIFEFLNRTRIKYKRF